jgi:hypothetical protein
MTDDTRRTDTPLDHKSGVYETIPVDKAPG